MEHGKLNSVKRDDSIFAGAIFMSNRETKLECLQRKLFGLPLSKSKFLKQVKAGMILFLFEHEERKLYGVFEATSDGALNIIPGAFRSTGQSYPAQILFKRIWLFKPQCEGEFCSAIEEHYHSSNKFHIFFLSFGFSNNLFVLKILFKRIWMCKPLCEDEFCSAIKENYYSSNKFHFGLSYEQVIKLIHLFHSRKINIRQYKGHGMMPNKIIEKFENSDEDEVRLTEREPYFKCRSDEYSGEGKREVTRQLAPPPASPDPAMPCKRPAYTASLQHTVAITGRGPNPESSCPSSCPQNSYSETLNSQRCSVLHHFSIGNPPPTFSENEYEPLPWRASELPSNGPSMIPRIAMIHEGDAFSSLHAMNHSSPRTEIARLAGVSGAQPNQVFEFPGYIPLVEEPMQKLDNRENQNHRLENSEYFPSSRLGSYYIPSTSKEISESFYSSDDAELKARRRAEAGEYNLFSRTLYADSDSGRTSVFSRLSRLQKACDHETPEPSSGEPSGGLSLDQFLNILSTRRSRWSAMAASKQVMEWDGNGCAVSSGHQNKITQPPIQPVERSEIDQYEAITDHAGFPAALYSDLSNGELPFYNFRRRNYSNEHGDMCGSEAKLMKGKRRRIVRPSLHPEAIKSVKEEAGVEISAQNKEKTEAEASAQVILETEIESRADGEDNLLDGVAPGLQTVGNYEPVGESTEQNHVASTYETLDYIPID